ncbi:28S ribosomal protein S9, mitochondrial [Electrophorus electricus]|uniref:Small ribosomal subunit protein uS9m n=1 Tax=Electrophorus electricus TaxID=8005 RepID=A0A4W4GRT7_ELEEL|nr:28S ribosomal protein S9, mitochondrial [Electrophorus electricus]
MAASSRSVFSSCLNYTRSFSLTSTRTSRQFTRQICVSSRVQVNKAARGPEKFSIEYIRKHAEEFEVGKRRLANMMGEDPETFTQQDVDRSIEYLFPSGLFEKKARPVMKHPELIFPKQTAAQWDKDGRPFHFLFYTGTPSFYSIMHDTFGKVLAIEKHQDQMRSKGALPQDSKQISLGGSRWLLKEELEEVLVENISDQDYSRFLQLMDKLLSLPFCALEEEFVQRFRKQLEIQSTKQEIPDVHCDENGRSYSQAQGRRKTATASVTLRDCGSGRVAVNGKDCLLYFPILQDREQIMFPLHFAGMLGRFDVQAHVEGGGRSAQAGALRLAIARALLSFVSTPAEVETIRQAGLLTADPRIKERQKPGQAGARKKYTWKKR